MHNADAGSPTCTRMGRAPRYAPSQRQDKADASFIRGVGARSDS